MSAAQNIVWFSDLDTQSSYFGSHSRRKAKLTQAELPLVPGFVITTQAYRDFLHENALDHKIKQLLSITSFELADSLMQTEFHIKQLFDQAKLSDAFIEELLHFYVQLGPNVLIELHELGNHGKKHHKKKISAEDKLTDSILTSWSDMFSAKALWYRNQVHHDHIASNCEITVEKKIHSHKKGLVFTIDPTHHAKDKIFILTQKPHDSDSYVLSKKNLTIIDRELKHKTHEPKLTLDEILDIAKMAQKLDEHLYLPQEISWIMDGSRVYITGIRPFTQVKKQKPERKSKIPIARGKGLTHSIGTGIVTIINPYSHIPVINAHSVVVVHEMKPQELKKLKKIKGLVMENHPHGELTVLLKQRGIPTICNVKHATKRFRNGHIVTIHGAKGEVYQGGFLN
jgi:pyruvate,water dikinase